MKVTEIKSERIGDKYIKAEHESGLNIYIYEKKGYNSTYATYGTSYGSINTKFKVQNDNDITQVPAGIAHYLEHKLFESEDGDAFAKYAATGASANAYTSFDKTCYLFSCTQNFEESLKILLEFVNSPYFTEKTVQKEQGIIGQEIRMYDDDPNWRVTFNLLQAMYHNHPVKIDIAGTVESISKITAEKLYKCYNTFYTPNNMAICICGNVNTEKTLSLIESLLTNKKPCNLKNIFPEEPESIVKKRVEQKFEISVPLFQLGFKEPASNTRLDVKKIAQTGIILEILSSRSSPLYNKLLKNNLANTSFDCEYFEGPGYSSIIFSGESNNPDLASEIIKEEVNKLHHHKIDEKTFKLAKRSLYGKVLASLNSTANIANTLISFAFSNREFFEYIDYISKCTIDDVNQRLSEQLNTENCSLSIVSPISKGDK